MVMNTQRMRRYDTTTRRWYGCSDAQGGWTHPMIRCQGTSRVHRRWRTNRPTRHKAPVATSPSKVNPGTDLLGWTLGTILVAIHHFLRVTRKGFKKPNSMNLGWHQVCLNQKNLEIIGQEDTCPIGSPFFGVHLSMFLLVVPRFAAYVVISSCCIGVFLGHAPMICIHSSHSPPI